ncbi:MAG: YraN family protein [Pseudomonadota bacterium]|nr:YraN family protein [Pseudomonadota bacterium]
MTGRLEAYRHGRRAETLAAWRLRLAGWRILAHNWRSPVGEIDLIARRGNVIAFVEVKARRAASDAMAAVTARSQARIRRAAENWLSCHPEHAMKTLRFDLVLITSRLWPRHVPNAFGADR